MLIDIGVNLTNKRFSADLPEVLERAQTAGVSTMIVTGTDVGNSQQAHHLCKKHPGILYSTAGVHPHHAKHWHEKAAQHLLDLAKEPNVVALGECGLDFNRNFSPPEQQKHAFSEQLELAIECGLPVFLHQRDAHKDFVQILHKFRPQLAGVVVHCFTGEESELKDYLDLDCHIGITGWICDERRGTHLLEFVNLIPDQRLMVETDAPYLLPRSLTQKPRNGRNEPAFLPAVVTAVAGARGQSYEEVCHLTSNTARQFFNLPD